MEKMGPLLLPLLLWKLPPPPPPPPFIWA
jgi:hypothetical protein